MSKIYIGNLQVIITELIKFVVKWLKNIWEKTLVINWGNTDMTYTDWQISEG